MQQDILADGPTELAAGDWVVTHAPTMDLEDGEHLATGQRHYLHGYLMLLDEQWGDRWSGQAYLHTCNGWTLAGRGWALPEELQHATVEPWPGDPDDAPEEVTLVGPTATHWAASRGRLRWMDAGPEPHAYYGCVISASLQRIRAQWNQERSGAPRPQPRMMKQAEALGRDGGTTGIGHSFEMVQNAPWSPKLSTFAWKLVAGVLPLGRATGCKLAPDYIDETGECMLCRDAGMEDTVAHVFGACRCLQVLRDWVRDALQHVVGWAAPLDGGEMLHLVYGRDSHTAADVTIRGAALDTIRALRAARISSEHRIAKAIRLGLPPEARVDTPTQRSIRKALRDRLGVAIMEDWRAAIGEAAGRHSRGSVDGRARQRRPSGQEEFLERWGRVSEVADGKCVPRPRWIESASAGDRPPD